MAINAELRPAGQKWALRPDGADKDAAEVLGVRGARPRGEEVEREPHDLDLPAP